MGGGAGADALAETPTTTATFLAFHGIVYGILC